MRYLLLILMGTSYGLLSAAGVFTVFVAVGLVPRFAGRTRTAKHVFLYEELVIFGTMFGCLLSVFCRYMRAGSFLRLRLPGMTWLWEALGTSLQAVYGLFVGMFIGCLALAIAEMLDSIPVFARRISFRHGLGLAVLSMACGKLAGSFAYFSFEFYRTLK